MNYYPFHIGDYASHTAHLEPMEDLAYRRLLDVYYTRETPLPADVQATAKLARMRSMAADVEAVLNEFFVLTEEGWRHKRCDSVIAHFSEKQAKARASAQASVNARRAKALNARSTDANELVNERSTDAEESATNVELPKPKPKPNKEESSGELLSPATPAPTPGGKPKTAALLPPKDVDPQIWADWIKLRNAKKAPATQTVVVTARKEAEKAGMSFDEFLSVWCARGSQGLQADWLTPAERRGSANASPFAGAL